MDTSWPIDIAPVDQLTATPVPPVTAVLALAFVKYKFVNSVTLAVVKLG